MSRASMAFLQRQRIFIPQIQHMPKFGACCLLSHQRPIKPARGLLGADHPDNRVITQREGDRVPYACPPKVRPQSNCC